MAKMKALVLNGPHDFVLTEREIPQPAPDQVLLKIIAAGICGTDMHIFHGNASDGNEANFPIILGHEVSGEVVALGKNVTSLKIGDRVAVDPNVLCGHCEFCRSNNNHLCKNNSCFGIVVDGGFAEYGVISENFAYKIPDNMSWLEGAMIEPVACCMRGADMAQYIVGDSVLIHGGGPIGNFHVQLAKLRGVSTIIVSEPIPSRRELALKMGADYAFDPLAQNLYQEVRKILPDGPRVIVDCSGRPEVVEESVRQVRWGGRVVLFGICPADADIKINPAYVNGREITICGSYDYINAHQPAIDAIAAGRLSVEPLISHVFSLDDYEKAFATFGAKDSMKIIIAPNGLDLIKRKTP